jgi:hypothetical protein
MEAETRRWMESRFHHDFSTVRLHTSPEAARSARSLNAHSYAVGRDLVFSGGAYQPENPAGRWVLAHELSHVVQQGGRAAEDVGEIGTEERASLESKATVDANTVRAGLAVDPTSALSEPALMRLTPAEFKDKLGSTPDQKSIIAALFADKAFLEMWNYLGSCGATPAKDLGPLTLKVTPGLSDGGVERFGGYTHGSRTLEINPDKAEHKANPSELVDTVVHELIHAEDDLQAACKAVGSGSAPLHGAATKTPTKTLADVKVTPEEDKLLADVGPGASNPCEEFIDVNKTAQQIVIEIVHRGMKKTKVGKPTITYLNELLRRFPAAIPDYKKCRNTACAETDEDAKKAAISACTNSIMTKYLPIAKDLNP